MAITTLDAQTALVVIDLQKGVVSLPTVHPAGEIVERARALAAEFRRLALPVVLVRVAGRAPGRTEQVRARIELPTDWAEFVPGLQAPGDHVVTKRSWGAFTNTALDEHLARHAVTQIVLAGISTSGGVESTARQAHDRGFHVTLAVDVMTDVDGGAHANSVTRIFPRLGETGTADDVLRVLQARA